VARAESAFHNSLRHLGQSSVYGLLVHHSADLLSPGGERMYALLQRLKDESLVRKIGVSVYDKNEVDRLFGKYAFDLVQLPLNVFDQRFDQDGTIQRLHEAGVEIHVRSVFLQGILLMLTAELPPYLKNLKQHHEHYLSTLMEAGVSPLTSALGYFRNRPEVSTVLVGVETSAQLKECLSATGDVSCINFSDFAVNAPQLLDPRAWQ
jgi:aryl-alcohol dehydrogenase-like predicted oxidoreductase